MRFLRAARWVVLLGAVSPASCLELPAKPLAGLRSLEFREREEAQGELLQWARKQPEPAMKELLKQAVGSEDPEVRERCMNILRELVMDEYATDGKGYLGITMLNEMTVIPGDPQPCNAIRVAQMVEGAAAKNAGVRLNDLIVSLNGEFWRDQPAMEPFAARIRVLKPRDKVKLSILREGKLIELEVVLGKRPPSLDNPMMNNGLFLDPGAVDRADKEAFFRRWMDAHKLPEKPSP